jgi:GxxExxY protein
MKDCYKTHRNIDSITKREIDDLSFQIIGAAIEVHKNVGRGLLESVYHECMKEELKLRKLNFITEKRVPLIYKGNELDVNFRCDLLVENKIVVELKSVLEMNKIFEAQILTYMNLLHVPKGVLVNFNCYNVFKDGQKTFVNDVYRNLK